MQIALDPNSGMPAGVREKALEAIPTMMDNVARAYKAGVKIACGTDLGEPVCPGNSRAGLVKLTHPPGDLRADAKAQGC